MDYTQTSTFLACPERYRLRYLEKIRKIKEGDIEAPKRFGEAIHAALECKYTKQPLESALAAFAQIYPASLDPMDLSRTPETGAALIRAYWNHYEEDASFEILDVEKVLEHPLNGFKWQAKVDAVVRTAGGIWGLEHKTTGKTFSEFYWKSFEPNSQLSGQSWLIQKAYGQCSGIIVNALKMGFRKRAYKGEVAGFHYDFQRQRFNRTPQQIQDWMARMTKTMQRIESLEPTDVWEKHEGQCGWCEYRELCLSCGDEQVKDVLYEPYNSYAYLEEGT